MLITDNKNIKTYYYDCACNSPEHTIRFVMDIEIDPKTNKPTEVDLYTEVQLNNYRNLFQRIWVAIKYICGYECRYGHWDCWSLKSEDAIAMRNMLNKYLENHFEKQNQA